MSGHWLDYLPEVGKFLMGQAVYQSCLAEEIKQAEDKLELLREKYRLEEVRLRKLASEHWTQEEINKAVIDCSEAKK